MKRYEKYKHSGVDWIGEIPEGWKVRRIKTLFKEINERSFDGSEDLLSVSQYTGVTKKRDKVEEGDLLTNASTLEGYKIVRNGDLVSNIMLAWNGSLGFSQYDGITSPAYSIYRLKNNEEKQFFHYLFRTKNKVFMKTLGAGVRQTINFNDLADTHLVLPPLPEQTAIAAFLDDKTAKIDQTIAIRQKEIELLKERRQILIQKAVTKGLDDTVKLKPSGVDWFGEIPEHWEVRKLKQVCRINLESLDEKTNPNYEFEYIDIGSVTYENGIVNKESFLFKNAPSRARRIVQEGDTIVSTVRTYLKAIDFIDKSKSKYIYSTGFAILQPNKDIFPKYLSVFIKSDAFTEQVSVNSKGMSYPAINSTELGMQKVLYLPYKEQLQIVSYLEKIEEKITKAISIKEQEIEKLKEYKTVLIDSVVTGKVRVS